MTNYKDTNYESRALMEEAAILASELEQATAVKLSMARRAPIEDPWEGGTFLGAMSGGTASTFPEWFGSFGRNKETILKNLRAIAAGKETKNKLAQDLKDLMIDHLTNGRHTGWGFIPPDANFSN